MLKCILFLLSEYYEAVRSEYQEIIARKFEGKGVQAKFGFAGSAYAAETEEIDAPHTLIVTDQASVFGRMHREGCYVIALYHEGNREESFPGARYAVEDLLEVEYDSYEEAFKRLAGIPWDILETERMRVRESIPEDVDEFYRIYSDPSITCYMEDLFPEKEQEKAYLKAYAEQIYEFYGFGLWTVIEKESGHIIGRAGLNVREGYDLPEIGFIIDVEHQRQGYAFEVCRAILDYAGEKLEFNAVQAFADEENQASLHLLKKLGFRPEDRAEFDERCRRFVKVL